MTRGAPLLLVCAAAACSIGAFEDRESEAPSQSSGTPDGVESEDYGAGVAPVITDRRGVHFAVFGRAPNSLSTVSYEDDGALFLAGRQLDELEGVSGNATLVSSPEPIRGADGMLALGGLGDVGTIFLLDARTGELGPQVRATLDGSDCGGPPLDDFGYSMVFALTDLGAPDEPELVALAEGELVVFVDIKPDFEPTCLRCSLELIGGGPQSGVSLAAGELGGPSGEEVLLYVRSTEGGAGQLLAFFGSTVEAHHNEGATCFTYETPQISNLTLGQGEEDLGSRMAVGQADDIGGLEVALSAPSADRVYLLPNLGTSGPGGLPEPISGDASAANFGAELVFGDLDGDDEDELVIGDPGATVDGEARAGQAWVFDLTDEGPELAARLHDSTPQEDQSFGRALAVSEFVAIDDDFDLLVVGADDEVFTYFRALPAALDPRL